MFAQADAATDVSLASKPYSKIREIASEDGSLLVVPIGSVEQHGPHLPVATDTLLANEVAIGGAGEVSDVPVLVTPPIWSGHSPHHMPFGGTLTLSFRRALGLVEDVAASGLDNGFDAVLFVNGHGGNGPLIDAAVSTIGQEHPSVDVLGLTYFELAVPFVDEIRESDEGGMAHAGEFETSLMLHLYPDLVHPERADGTYLDEPYELGDVDLLKGGALSVYRTFNEYAETGAIGDPKLASEEKGEALFAGIRAELADLLEEIHRRNCVDN